MTRTASPFNSRESAMIEPVFPLAPKITYMPFETTGEIMASTSLICEKGVERLQDDRFLSAVTWGMCLQTWEGR
jgi:hypothetical protein